MTIKVGAIRGPKISPRDSANYMALKQFGIEVEHIGMFTEGVYDRTANRDETFFCPTREIGSYEEISKDDYDIIDVVSLSDYVGSEYGADIFDRIIPVIAENRHPKDADKVSDIIMSKYSHCVCYTRDSYRYADLAGIERKTQIYPSVNLDVFHPRRKEKNWDGIRVLFNARPSWEKGFPYVVAAANINPDMDFYFRSTMSEKNKQLLPENCHYVPEMPYVKLAELYRDMDVLVHPANAFFQGYWEQWGNVFLEAMASGLYIIGTTNGTIPEVLEGTESTILDDRTIDKDLRGVLRRIGNGEIDISKAMNINREVAEVRYNPEINCMMYSCVVEKVMA